MSKQRKQDVRRKRRIVKKTVKLLWILLPLCLLLTGGYYVYAKYLAQSVQRGITIASSIYFTSNYAAPSDGDREDMSDALVSVVQSTDSDGMSYDFAVEIRNYENILLFNNSNAQIPYKVEFWLAEDAAAGDNYQVSATVRTQKPDGTFAETTETRSLTKDNKAVFSNILIGGEARSDKYNFRVQSADGKKTVPVYVRAGTESGALLTELLKGKMLLQPRTDSGEFLKSFGFSTTGNTAEEQWKFLEKQSEFSYKIITGGISGESGSNAEMVTLYWEPTVYDIDRFSNAWLDWEKTEGNTVQTVQKSALESKYPDQNWEGWSDTIHAITVRVNAHASIHIGFFRETGYSSKVTSIELQNKFVYVGKGNQLKTN